MVGGEKNLASLAVVFLRSKKPPSIAVAAIVHSRCHMHMRRSEPLNISLEAYGRSVIKQMYFVPFQVPHAPVRLSTFGVRFMAYSQRGTPEAPAELLSVRLAQVPHAPVGSENRGFEVFYILYEHTKVSGGRERTVRPYGNRLSPRRSGKKSRKIHTVA